MPKCNEMIADINVHIPIDEICSLLENFQEVRFEKGDKSTIVYLKYRCERESFEITGRYFYHNSEIQLDSKQHGFFENSTDGGITWILSTYSGDGRVTSIDKSGEITVILYNNGDANIGKVVFENRGKRHEV